MARNDKARKALDAVAHLAAEVERLEDENRSLLREKLRLEAELEALRGQEGEG